jgi:hypothetical protein
MTASAAARHWSVPVVLLGVWGLVLWLLFTAAYELRRGEIRYRGQRHYRGHDSILYWLVGGLKLFAGAGLTALAPYFVWRWFFAATR